MDIFELTEDERNLYIKIGELEERFFEDMTFQEDSLCWDIYQMVSENFDDIPTGIWENGCTPKIISDDKSGLYGFVDLKDKTINMIDTYAEDESVILHEMIHAYEDITLDTILPGAGEYLLLRLYKKLNPLINDLDDRISQHMEVYSQTRINSIGGKHGLLFLLKSFDLDLRCGYELGTVCGYGRNTDDFYW